MHDSDESQLKFLITFIFVLYLFIWMFVLDQILFYSIVKVCEGSI